MKTCLECIPCFFKQALEAARLSGANPKTQKKILDAVALHIPKFPLRSSPPEMARDIHGIVKKITGKDDPYVKIKEKSNALALKVYPRLKRKVACSHDKLLTAIELAIAGNIIDYGVKNSLNVKKELDIILDKESEAIRRESKSIFDYGRFKHALKDTKTILYLADNAGEVVFDRVLIEEIRRRDSNKEIFYAVKESPAINDALGEDAVACGIDKIARVISSGADAPGTILSLCSKQFLKIYKKVDMIISKGQGNFEALSRPRRPVFFMFMAKCAVIADEVGCKNGSVNLLYRGPNV
jgi:uncharacterized protein with ATP-grasp and redox domains